MDEGVVQADGTPRAVFAQGEMLKELGLDVPQPTALCALLREHGVDIPADLLTPEECAGALLNLMN